MTDKEYYCSVANDGVAVCVCKYRPCEKLKRKEQECEQLKSENLIFEKRVEAQDNLIENYRRAFDEIEEIARHNNFLVRDPFCGTGYRDLSGQILNIINKAKE